MGALGFTDIQCIQQSPDTPCSRLHLLHAWPHKGRSQSANKDSFWTLNRGLACGTVQISTQVMRLWSKTFLTSKEILSFKTTLPIVLITDDQPPLNMMRTYCSIPLSAASSWFHHVIFFAKINAICCSEKVYILQHCDNQWWDVTKCIYSSTSIQFWGTTWILFYMYIYIYIYCTLHAASEPKTCMC